MPAKRMRPKDISRARIDQLTDGEIDAFLRFVSEIAVLAVVTGDPWVPDHVFFYVNPTFPGLLAYDVCRRWGIAFGILQSRERREGGHDCRVVYVPDSLIPPRVMARMKYKIEQAQASASAAMRTMN